MNRWLLLVFCIVFIIALVINPGVMAILLLYLGVCLLLITLILGLPVAWIYSEFHGKRWLRILLGVVMLLYFLLGLSFVHGLTSRFNYNAHYGAATDDLIKTSIEQIEDGNLDRVLQVWRGLDFQYRPTYEHKAGYKELAQEAVQLMKGAPIEPETPWDVSMFSESTWHGHWKGDEAFWFFIGRGNPFDIVYHGYSSDEPKSISISPDYDVLTFTVYGTVLHRITLRNKYEALHEWFEVETNRMIGTQTLYKYIRPPEEMRRVTRQEEEQSDAYPCQ